MTPEPGERQRFGRYETLFRIAGGGMAEVYAARALGEGGFQKLVALKRMRPELAEDARFVTMFLDEGRLAANIASPNVVSTLDLGRARDNSLYLVMELVKGVSLQQLITEASARGTTIPIPIAVDIVAQAAAGLHDAHEARSPSGEPLSIVHRDCSPHNVLIDVNGQAKITDFGIAKAMERQTQSHAGEMKGKLCYLSAEQARGHPVDRRADVFILGIVAWEILTGQLLFDADHPVEALHKVTSMPIPPVDAINPRVSSDLAAAVAQALERDPDARFGTAAAFGNALSNALGGRPPPRSEIGAFVREHGGRPLRHLQQSIREALGKPDSTPPPPSEASVDAAALRPPKLPSELAPPQDPPGPRRRRLATRPMGSSPPPAMAATDPAVTDPAVTPPQAERARRARATTEPMPEGAGHATAAPSQPRLAAAPSPDAAPSRPRLATEPMPKPFPRTRHGTVALPEVEPTTSPERARAASGALWKLAAVVSLLFMGGSAAALGAWYSERSSNEEDGSVDERAPVVASPAPAPRPEPRTTAAPEPEPQIEPPAHELASPEPPAPEPPHEPPAHERPRARAPRAPRPPPRTEREPGTITGTPANPQGDRASTFDEIPWDRTPR